jgi:streptogramin lyase
MGVVRRVALLVAVSLSVFAVPAGVAMAVSITEQTSGLQSGQWPAYASPGSDGNVWFTFWGCPSIPTCGIARITPSGAITEFTSGLQAGAFPTYITSGPDGNLWFSDAPETGPPPAIGRITPSGTITEYFAGLVGYPRGITGGPDGNVWFTENGGGNNLARITPSGTITQFPTGLPNTDSLEEITRGADGNLWFPIRGADAGIGRMTPTGAFTEFTTGLMAGADPYAITTGPDGNVWFTDQTNKAIGRITPAGAITEFTAGLGAGHIPRELTPGSDGNVWFFDYTSTGPAVSRITPAGAVTEFTSGFQAHSAPRDISAGPDGNLWFTDQACNGGPDPCAIGHVLLQLPPAVTTGAATGVTSSGATVHGTVNPLGGAVSAITARYTTADGTTHSVSASPASLPAGGAPLPIVSTLSNLPPETTITYAVSATNAYGTSAGTQQTLTTPATTPTISGLHQSRKRWRPSGRHASLARARKRGTSLSFTLNEAATLKLAFARRPARKGKRSRPAGRISFTGHAGLNTIRFYGRLSGHRRLKPGRYKLTISAAASSFHSTRHTLRFTILGS